MNKSFIPYELTHGLIADLSSDEYPTQVWGFYPSDDNDELDLLAGSSYFGYVYSGELTIDTIERPEYEVYDRMYFSVSGDTRIYSTENCQALIVSRLGYNGTFMMGGPIEKTGRLNYISGCTDSLVIPPVVQGDPCLNALYFPPGIKQVPHTHPSMRVGMVVSGEGLCITEEESITLKPGMAFVIPANLLHSFWTLGQPLTVVAYHPDSDYGPTHENHPMLNKTIVDGISASLLESVRTHA